MQSYPKVAIIYLSFHSEPYLNDVIFALRRMTYPKDKVEFVVVDNLHPEYGSSVKFLEENLLPISGSEIPHVTILPQKTNLGFPGGNNAGIKWALENGFDYCLLHNNDGFLSADALEKMVETFEADKSIGTAQAMVLLHPETDLINTSGNSFQYLGYGFCGSFRRKYDKNEFKPVFDPAYVSGAAMLMRSDLLRQYGMMDEDYFLYHEDIEYSFRLKIHGYRTVTIRDAIFFHKYNFSRSKSKFYYIERNRYGLMYSYLRWPTLILFAPMAFVLDCGLLLFAAKSGWFREKIDAWKYWLKCENRAKWQLKRKAIQKTRKLSDREFTRAFVGSIKYEDKNFKSVLLTYFGNPLMSIYWFIIRNLILW